MAGDHTGSPTLKAAVAAWLIPRAPRRVGILHAGGLLLLGLVVAQTGLMLQAGTLGGAAIPDPDSGFGAAGVHNLVASLAAVAALPLVLGYLVVGVGPGRSVGSWLGVAGAWLWLLGLPAAALIDAPKAGETGWSFYTPYSEAAAGSLPSELAWLIPLAGLTLAALHVAAISLRRDGRWRVPIRAVTWAALAGALATAAVSLGVMVGQVSAATHEDLKVLIWWRTDPIFGASDWRLLALGAAPLVLGAAALVGLSHRPEHDTDPSAHSTPRRAPLTVRLLAIGILASLGIGVWAAFALGALDPNAPLHDSVIAVVPAHGVAGAVILATVLGSTRARPSRWSTGAAILVVAGTLGLLAAFVSLGATSLPRRYLELTAPGSGWGHVALVASILWILGLAAHAVLTLRRMPPRR